MQDILAIFYAFLHSVVTTLCNLLHMDNKPYPDFTVFKTGNIAQLVEPVFRIDKISRLLLAIFQFKSNFESFC